MLTCRTFRNNDSRLILDLWSRKVKEFPEFFAPLSMDLLEGQVLGNMLFDPASLIFAFDGSQEAVGFLHASFCPDVSGERSDPQTGILFAPVVRQDAANREEIFQTLIAAGENYLVSRGAKRWYAGGYANAAPFYTGLYGRCNPEGIYEKETAVLDAFEKAGYHSFSRSLLFRLELSGWRPPVSRKAHEAHQKYVVRRISDWSASSWWEANIYRNFSAAEWNVFAANDRARVPKPVAGLLIQQMQKNFYTVRAEADPFLRLILSYVGVLESHLRVGIASFLCASVFQEIAAAEYRPVVLETIVPEGDKRLAAFLDSQKFIETGAVRSFYRSAAKDGPPHE